MAKGMITKRVFRLTRQARKAGGDRYETELGTGQDSWALYIPQSISRSESSIVSSFIVTFEEERRMSRRGEKKDSD